MNGPSKVCALVTTKINVYNDPYGVKNGLWPLRCLQRNLGFFGNIQQHLPGTKTPDNICICNKVLQLSEKILWPLINAVAEKLHIYTSILNFLKHN